MAKSRYSDTPIVSDHHYETFRLPVLARGYRELNLLDNIKTTDYQWQAGDRLDKLAARFYGEEEYWWIIAIANNVIYPFASGGLVPGRTLKIPVDVKDVLDRIFS